MKVILILFLTALVFSSNSNADTTDTRTVIQLSAQHRAMVLAEMRQFLTGLQQITDALSRDDMETVARESRSLGTVMSHHMPVELKQALPQGFRKLGGSVHKDFDRIALDAESLGDSSHTLSQLSQTLSSCVSCHNQYQIRSQANR